MRKIGFAALVAVTTASIAPAEEPAAPVFMLSAKLIDAGRIVGEPRLAIKAGEPATVRIGDATGNSYVMTLTARPQSADTILIDTAIDFKSTISGHQVVNPKMLVRVGKASAIEFGRNDATVSPFHIDVTLDRTTG